MSNQPSAAFIEADREISEIRNARERRPLPIPDPFIVEHGVTGSRPRVRLSGEQAQREMEGYSFTAH